MFSRSLSCLALMAAMCVPSFAQERNQDTSGHIFSSREEYNEFIKELRTLKDPEIEKMIPAINEVLMSNHGLKKRAFGTPFNSEQSWMLRLLENDGVRKEIEMVDYQYEDLKKTTREIHDQMEDEIRDIVRQQADGKVDAKKFRTQLISLRDRAEAQLDEALFPMQKDRLRQVLLHGRLLREPLVRVMTTDPIADQLDLSDRQKKQLQEEWKEIEKKLNEDIAKLRKKARQELVDTLPKKQQRRFDELFGDAFEFRANEDKKQNERERSSR